MRELAGLRAEIRNHASNAWATDRGYEPIYTASPRSKIVVIGQAPGKQAQESQIPWNDASGIKLREWLALTDAQFYDPDTIALLPMDFYYPGKGTHGDLPPRREFASLWHPRILRLMPELRLTVLVGNYAQKHYLGSAAKKNLTETVRAYDDYAPDRIPLVHPSPLNFRWQAKNPWFEADVIPALQSLVAAAISEPAVKDATRSGLRTSHHP
ncbi:uracil-DNA glycosylase [Kribbella voronezhensis]|uniref:Uracil-DNA glycosylase n=2 Tax=Kribbella voronezhensis TaxID=2512212 RepID=A0A4R7SWH8_9ACTN|nr:uracil-DNA glycosylase [Kribbella voronezhensis]